MTNLPAPSWQLPALRENRVRAVLVEMEKQPKTVYVDPVPCGDGMESSGFETTEYPAKPHRPGDIIRLDTSPTDEPRAWSDIMAGSKRLVDPDNDYRFPILTIQPLYLPDITEEQAEALGVKPAPPMSQTAREELYQNMYPKGFDRHVWYCTVEPGKE